MAANMTKQIGLGAAEFLLLAKAHLVKANDAMHQGALPMSGPIYDARQDIQWALDSTRHALELLKQEKEEPCKP